ncbi:acetylglutamate kinase [Mycetocola reblochoni]|uniref:Acetylglutamate kinase n=1 Tax=Mycetocola reblochoni TaxID=331618 RepID=A0A3L6ZJW6_9MICO|nr:acetylglutamate kinase [Mycetocola reblochoni]RLP68143.1 acetylglutamate kinase [Mycetocola reblochoni]
MTENTDGQPVQGALEKAAILIEALPWIRRFRGEIVVIKFGGNAMVSPELQESFAEDMVFLRSVGVHPVVVHGGGPQITRALTERGIASEFRGGYRYTSPQAMAVVDEVLRTQVNRGIVERIAEVGGHALGLSGQDDRLFSGVRRTALVDGEEVDLGHVGDIVQVRPDAVRAAVRDGLIPVVSSISPERGVESSLLNVNADTAASVLAVALRAAKLMVLTDVQGLYRDWPRRDSLVSSIGSEELRELLPTLESGMIPKMSACLDAVDGGVSKAAIIDGRLPHSVLLEIFTPEGIGTEVTPEDNE